LRWFAAPRWYVWDGGFIVLGKTEGVVPAHSHHAIQVVLALDGSVAVQPPRGVWREGRGVIVRQDAEHLFDGKGASGAMLFVDPESSEGAWLGTLLDDAVTVIPESRLQPAFAALRALREPTLDGIEPGARIRSCVLSLCDGAPPARRRDARISAVLATIRDSDDLRMSLETAAAIAFLSPSRFAHLFTQQVGLPFRRYMLWRKVTRAMLAIGRKRMLADAAHAADFADAAHLTRTFHRMFGIAPSLMMRGELLEIASPFGADAEPRSPLAGSS
jgi:AraC-like DNA-binding protein